MSEKQNKLLRDLPSISTFLTSEEGRGLSDTFGEGLVKLVLRTYIDELRREIQNGEKSAVPDFRSLADGLSPVLTRYTNPLARKSINATGVLLHTGLGRAPLAKTAIEAMNTAQGYSVVQVDQQSGGRSLREEKIERMLGTLTGCEAVSLANNNAAATMIILNTLAKGKEVIISRGQLVEIGGSYRLPDVMLQSGVLLREVGTTNRTHLHDYENAITENSGAILHVHPSNYRIEGFSKTPSVEELCVLGKEKGLPVIADLGSGAVVPMSEFGIDNNLTIGEALRAGAEVTCSSGDKLIGGPQSGIICGKREVVETIRKNPYARMFRVCKLTLAALEATLIHYVNEDYKENIPLYQMLSTSLDELEERAGILLDKLQGISGINMTVADGVSYIGGGALPEEALDSKVLRIESAVQSERNRFSAQVSKSLRLGVPPVFCRVADETLVFDMRSLFPEDLNLLAQTLRDTITRQNS